MTMGATRASKGSSRGRSHRVQIKYTALGITPGNISGWVGVLGAIYLFLHYLAEISH
jgi:hypothetical protein